MAELPTGTVAFLYTDIEGSTAQWERQPQAMRAAVARHHTPLREAIAAQHGHVFRTVGDGLCAPATHAPMTRRPPLARLYQTCPYVAVVAAVAEEFGAILRARDLGGLYMWV